MKIFFLLSLSLIVLVGCSTNENSNPVSKEYTATGFMRASVNGGSWYSNQVLTSKSGNVRYLKSEQPIVNNSKFLSSVLEMWIGINQAGQVGIGEDEPGFTYGVRATYTLKSISGSQDEKYKAYFQDYSFLTINRISNTNLDAVFIFRAFTDDTLKSIVVSDGVIKLDF